MLLRRVLFNALTTSYYFLYLLSGNKRYLQSTPLKLAIIFLVHLVISLLRWIGEQILYNMQKHASAAKDHEHRKHTISRSLGYLSFMLLVTPLTSIWWGAITDYNGSLQLSVTKFMADPRASLSWYSLPSHDISITFAKWIVFEVILYTVLPGRVCAGQPTPSGHTLPYTLNGLSFFICSITSFVVSAALGWTELSFIAKNWGDIILAVNAFAWLLTGLAFVKGRIAPSYKYDTKGSGKKIIPNCIRLSNDCWQIPTLKISGEALNYILDSVPHGTLKSSTTDVGQ